MGDGIFLIQMRPNYNVIVYHPCRTAHWQRFYFYVKYDGFAFEEPPDDSLLFLGALIKKKLSGAKKASSATLSETTPSETTPPAPLPPAPLPLAVSPGPSVGPVNAESSREDLMRTSERETAEPSVTDGNKKKRSAPDSSASAASQARTESDGPLKKKKKKEKKKKHVEGQSEPIGDIEGRETATEEGSSRDAATRAVVELNDSPIVLPKRKKTSRSHESSTPAESASAAKTPSAAPPTIVEGGSASEERRVKFCDHVEFKYVSETPLSYTPSECAELIRQFKGGRRDLPAVKDLFFKDAYVDAARTKILVRPILLDSSPLYSCF